MIKTLTPEQLAEEERICQLWIKKAFRTESISPEEAETAVTSLYKLLGEPTPKYVVAPGPLAAWKLVVESATPDPKKRRELEKTVVLPLIDGVINAGYYAYLDFLDFIGVDVKSIREVELYRTLAAVSWVWPLENVCVLCDHPKQLHVNADGNLHNESGPSVEYRDGLKLWDINGVQVDEQIVMRPETQTIKQINADTNADRQTLRIERYGWLKYLGESNATVLDERRNDTQGTLEVLYKTQIGNEVTHRLVATCITGKIPVMGVPARINTCEAAQEWLNGERKINIVGRT